MKKRDHSSLETNVGIVNENILNCVVLGGSGRGDDQNQKDIRIYKSAYTSNSLNVLIFDFVFLNNKEFLGIILF